MTEQWFMDARDLGLEWVRLAYDKWDSDHRDFLIGNASHYQGLVKEDLEKLKEVITWAEKYDIQLVISPLSLPGARYSQNNDNVPDTRLWEDFVFWRQAIKFWVDLSKELKGYDNVVAYNIVNEPHPELGAGVKEHDVPGDVTRFIEWYEKVRETPRDIYKFYLSIINEIRKVDPDKMIMVDAGWYGQPGAFCYWPAAFEDENILYAFHMYEPWEFTSYKNFREKNNYEYPGSVPFGKDTVFWDKETIELYFKPFVNWIGERNIPGNRIVAGEFGCMRRNKGAARYLEDVIEFLNKKRFHWAFYSFREDAWDGYDYELGKEALGWEYWQAKEKNENPPLQRKDTKMFKVIKNQFRMDD
jgi:aryl-phospho-beta-D-glucosidase BglC (GH1 family)